MLPVGNPASWMVEHDKDACFASNSCGHIANKCVALGNAVKISFYLQSEILLRLSASFLRQES